MKHLPLLFLLASSTVALGVDIQANDGRSIDASILSADAATVKIRITSSGKQSVIRRDTLSLQTNNLIDDFLKQKREEQLERERDLTTFDVKFGGSLKRVTLWLPNPKVALAPRGNGITISGGKGSNHISFHFYANPKDGAAEKAVNEQKQNSLRMAAQTSQKLVDKLNKLMTVSAKSYGPWKGFFLEGWTERQANEAPFSNVLTHANQGYFVNEKVGFSIGAYFGEGGDFQRKDIERIVRSLTVTEIE
jgi:hypothetical protein